MYFFNECIFKRVFPIKHTVVHIMGLVGPIDMKKATTSNGCWADCVTSTFNLIHDLDLVFSKSNFEITHVRNWRADFHGVQGM